MVLSLELPIIEAKQETPDVKSIKLSLQEKIDFKPGQYMMVYMDNNSKSLSIASSPTEDFLLFSTKSSESDFKQCFNSLKVGDKVKMKGPMGIFVLKEDAKDMERKLLKGEFNLMDLYNQMEAMAKMGPLGKVLEMVPGFGKISMPKEALKTQEGKLKKWKQAMNSMTKAELEDPEILTAERIDRISKGSGISTNDIRDMIKQYKQAKKMIKRMKGEKHEKLMKKFGRKAGPQMKY